MKKEIEEFNQWKDKQDKSFKKDFEARINGKGRKGMSSIGMTFDKLLKGQEIKDETTKKVHRKLEVIYYYIWYGLKKKNDETNRLSGLIVLNSL